MKKKYNHTVYKGVKTTNSFIRKQFSPDPSQSVKVFGVIGKIIGIVINKIIALPIHLLSFFITGLFYDRRMDKPYKGSCIYTVVFILLVFLIAGGITMIVKSIV